jgi:Predicted membrane protein (DUF2232)
MTSPVPAAPPAPSPIGRFELPLAALAGAAVFSAFFVVPGFAVVGAVVLPLAAVPVVRLAHRQGLVAGMTACVLTAAVVLGLGWAGGGAGSGLALAVAVLGLIALPTASVGFLRAGVDPSRCYVGLCLAGCALLVAGYAASANGAGASVSADSTALLDQVIKTQMESYARSGADAAAVARAREVFESVRDITRNYIWGMFGVLWVFGSAIAFYLGAFAARPGATADATRFENVRIPAAGAGLFVLAGAVFGLMPGEGRRLAGNLLLPLLALYFVAGLSIICHFFRRWFRVRILRVGLYALAAYFPINVGVALLGLFDWYVDFRRRGEGVVEKS